MSVLDIKQKAKHSSKSQEWFTPSDFIESARTVLGGIDLDPASCLEANDRVKARYYFTKDMDGLKKNWGPRASVEERPAIWLNPPGGLDENHKSIPKRFWEKLMSERQYIRHAIWMAFSIEQLQTLQIIDGDKGKSICRFPICIPNSRIKFQLPGNAKADQPTHANAIVYVPGHEDASGKFAAEFSKYGSIMWPSHELHRT